MARLCHRLLAVFVSASILSGLAGCSMTGAASVAFHAEGQGTGLTFYVAVGGNDGWSGLLQEANPEKTNGPFRTISKASSSARAGDTIVIGGGTYGEPINPVNSGSPGRPITYVNFGREPVLIGEASKIDGMNEKERAAVGDCLFAIYISGKSYITVEGIQVDFTAKGDQHEGRWARIIDSDHITLRNNSFRHSMVAHTNGGVHFIKSRYNTLTGNTFEEAFDDLTFVQSDHNLVDGNTFLRGRHTLWNIRAGSYNIIRNNYFHNALQKIGEIYDNGAWSARDFGTIEDNAAQHNVVENNIFAYTPPDLRGGGPYNGIQFAGQSCIIRNNVFYDNYGGGLGICVYFDEAYYNHSNRIYNNTLVRNHYGGISLPRIDETAPVYIFHNNILKNNILYLNDYLEFGDVRKSEGWVQLRGKPIHVWSTRTEGVFMIGNNLYSRPGEEDYAIGYGDNAEHHSLEWMQKSFPAAYHGNVNADPLFVKLHKGYDPAVPFAARHDFHLQSSSPMIDAGAFLTKIIPFMVQGEDGPGEGKGIEIAVEDPLYFSDGFGLVPGDRIRLQDGPEARIVKIRYGIRHNKITLDREVAWKAGQGVSLYFEGKGPDMGALEYSASAK